MCLLSDKWLCPPRRRDGVALLLVLSILVLLSALIIGLLVSARQEVVTAAGYSAGSDARLLADVPVNLVTAQIAAATADTDKAWISQPGLLRTFTGTGQDRAFKLYSSYEMTSADPAFNPGSAAVANAEVPANWYTRPNEYVDLNRPVQYRGRAIYPIVDPGVVDPGTDRTKDLVEGFSFDASRVKAPSGTAQENPLPMPVNWIYVLEDGKLVSASDPLRPTAVSRVAYWTDDETAKVNVNTASGGVFYDSPAVNTQEDHMLGRTEPIAQEYQRFPGHPATTSLAPVLKALRNITDPVARAKQAALLSPRIGWSGSQGGTRYAWWDYSTDSSVLVQTDLDRLFTSTDELAYQWDLTGDTRAPYTVAGSGSLDDSAQHVDQLRFFLTAQNRAPELNLFNRPRVTLWPFNQELVTSATSGANVLTPEDRLIRFASELGGVNDDGSFDYTRRKRFYFQRKSAWDPAADYRDIPENRALYSYLQKMTTLTPPSASTQRSANGASLATKFGANRDQILTEMWDYVRSQVNTVNQAYVPAQFTAYSFPQNHTTEQAGYNDIAPLVVTNNGVTTKGLGRFPVLTEVTLQFIDAGEQNEKNSSGAPIDAINNASGNAGADGIPDYVVRRVRLVLLLGFQMPSNNLLDSMGRFQVEISGVPFGIDLSDDTLNPGLAGLQAVKVRDATTAAGGAWGTTLDGSNGGAGIGFPAPSSNGSFRRMCYVAPFHLPGVSARGGSLGLGAAMYVPFSNAASTDNKDAAYSDHLPKVLSNRVAANSLAAEDSAYLGSQQSFSGREDIYYPFVSDVIEFRLPQSATTGAGVLAANKGGSDFFKVILRGTTLNINLYPGLKDNATALSPITSNWQSPTATNALWKTSVVIADAAIPLPRLGPANVRVQNYNVTTQSFYSDFQNYYARSSQRDADFLCNVPRDDSNPPKAPQMDVFRSYVLSGDAPLYGDIRLAALTQNVPSSWWQAYPRNEPGTFHGMGYFPTGMKGALKSNDPRELYNLSPDSTAVDNAPYAAVARTARMNAATQSYTTDLAVRRAASPVTTASRRDGSSTVGDFTLGFGDGSVGALVAGPDAGASSWSRATDAAGPYYSTDSTRGGDKNNTAQSDVYHTNFTGLVYSPWKQAPSPVVFGTLPSRALPNDGTAPGSWETLLFCPDPAGGRLTHRGWKDVPRDHYFLDLFYMPAVEPYALTENFATAGKINLNYQIAPFSYIKRKTALYALLDGFTAGALNPMSKGTVLAVPETLAGSTTFRSPNPGMSAAGTNSLRTLVDIDRTLQAFETRLDQNNDPFVSASEVCEMFLAPVGGGDAETFWNGMTLTGDDKLEAPYNAIYPRITTRSNTFRVHFWVQTLNAKTKPATPIVASEYRGSTVIERYLDPNVKTYGDPVGSGDNINVEAVFPPMNDRYRFRQTEHQQFAP